MHTRRRKCGRTYVVLFSLVDACLLVAICPRCLAEGINHAEQNAQEPEHSFLLFWRVVYAPNRGTGGIDM